LGRKVKAQTTGSNKVVLYARVFSKEQEREGCSIPGQCKLLRSHVRRNGCAVVRELIDVEPQNSPAVLTSPG